MRCLGIAGPGKAHGLRARGPRPIESESAARSPTSCAGSHVNQARESPGVLAQPELLLLVVLVVEYGCVRACSLNPSRNQFEEPGANPSILTDSLPHGVESNNHLNK